MLVCRSLRLIEQSRDRFIVFIPTRSGFECDWHIHCIHYRFQDVFNHIRMAQLCRARELLFTFGWAAHVDIDDLRTVFNAELRGFGHQLWKAAGNLY